MPTMLVIHKNVGQQRWFVLNMFKNVGQYFGYLMCDKIISNGFEDIAHNKQT